MRSLPSVRCMRGCWVPANLCHLTLQRISFHQYGAGTTPPPLTSAPLRRRPVVARHVSASIKDSTAATPTWFEALGDGGHPVARVALEELVHSFHSTEPPKLYAVYRPCGPGPSASPSHYLQLLRCLCGSSAMAQYAPRVAEVFFELLRKPLHPQHAGLWDLTAAHALTSKASAIQMVMDSTSDGREALSWLSLQLQVSATQQTRDDSEHLQWADDGARLHAAMVERLHRGTSSSGKASRGARFCFGDPDGEALLTQSSGVLAAIAAAMIRANGSRGEMKAMALDLLEVVALSRLHACGGGLSSHSTPPSPKVLLFNEQVAVHCAEAAALCGDSETVTRLIFLLYRARGALGFPTLDEHRREGRGGRRWVSEDLLQMPSRVTRWWWWTRCGVGGDRVVGGASHHYQHSRVVTDGTGEGPFEQAVIRLLKSAMHAVLYPSIRNPTTALRPTVVEEALAFFDGLKNATTWAGVAAMGTELLLFLLKQRSLRPTPSAVSLPRDGSGEEQLRRAALHVYRHLCRTAPRRRRTEIQQGVLDFCIGTVMQLYTTERELSTTSTTTYCVPMVADAPAAEQILQLFSEASAAKQELLLPCAMAASLTLLSAALQQQWVPPTSVRCFSGLTGYFAERSVHRFCAERNSDGVVVVSGALLLCHALLLTALPSNGLTTSGAMGTFLHRLMGQATDITGVQGLRAPAAGTPDVWLRIAATPQRQIFWRLLKELLQHDRANALHSTCTAAVSAVAFCDAVESVRPTLSTYERADVVRVLYHSGRSNDPEVAQRLLNHLLTDSMGVSIITMSLAQMKKDWEQMRMAAVLRRAPQPLVVVLSATTLRGGVRTHGTAAPNPTTDMLNLLQELQPLFCQSTKSARLPFLTLVLTPQCLEALRGGPASNTMASRADVLRELLKAELLSGSPQSQKAVVSNEHYRVVVASAWPTLPAVATVALDENVTDGIQESTALAHYLGDGAYTSVLLWCETPGIPNLEEKLLQSYGVQCISVRRAQVEKAKGDLCSLIRGADATCAAGTNSVVAAEAIHSTSVTSSVATAKRRTRDAKLLNVVGCHKATF